MSDMRTNDLVQELGSNFIEYAASVNTDRAIPDATSGLKPVARRILYAAYASGRTSSKPHVKCATIVGDVIGHYHPHGDSSVYGALVRLSQDWVMRYPLIDFHGNVGNIGGDGPAHYRYTEARLAKISEDGLLDGLKKKNVDFMPTFDDSDEEPVTLPSSFPNLLCNPNTGIGVAMACNWAPHNLREVAQAIFDYMDGKEPTLSGPDFPTGGLVINKDDIPSIMATGHGSVKVRGKYNIEKNNIVFYEIPYGVTTETLLAEVGDLCEKNEIEGITDIRDESNKKGMRIVFECGRGVNVDAVVKSLFAKTDLQSSFSYNQVALVNKTPVELNLKQCIEIYIKHNIECLVKELNCDLNKAQERKEIVDGLLKALEDIDNIINLIKKSESAAAARVQLVSVYKFTENQAKAIVDMKLGKLAGLEKIELQQEGRELEQQIHDINAILSSEELQKNQVRIKLTEIVKKYGDARRTELAQIEVPKEEKEVAEIIPENCVVVISQHGDIKRIAAASFKVQNRAGKGVKTSDAATLAILSTNTIDTVLLFTNKGKLFRVPVDKIPVGTNIAGGGRIAELAKLDADEYVLSATSVARANKAPFVVFFTKNGYVKKSKIEEYVETKKTTGIIAIKLSEGDEIANVVFCNEEEFFLLTEKGMGIRFESKLISPLGRIAMGVKGIKLEEGDRVLCGLVVPAAAVTLATFTDKGYGRRTALDQFPVQGRGGKGLLASRNSELCGNLVAAAFVIDKDNLILAGIPTSICIAAADIPLAARTSNGAILIKNSKITTVTKA